MHAKTILIAVGAAVVGYLVSRQLVGEPAAAAPVPVPKQGGTWSGDRAAVVAEKQALFGGPQDADLMEAEG